MARSMQKKLVPVILAHLGADERVVWIGGPRSGFIHSCLLIATDRRILSGQRRETGDRPWWFRTEWEKTSEEPDAKLVDFAKRELREGEELCWITTCRPENEMNRFVISMLGFVAVSIFIWWLGGLNATSATLIPVLVVLGVIMVHSANSFRTFAAAVTSQRLLLISRRIGMNRRFCARSVLRHHYRNWMDEVEKRRRVEGGKGN